METPVTAPGLETIQGFNILRRSEQGFRLMAVSDLNREELQEFRAKFEATMHGA